MSDAPAVAGEPIDGDDAEAQAAAHRAQPTRDPKPRKRAKRKRSTSTGGSAPAGEGEPQLRGAAAKAAMRSQSARLEARLAELLAFPAVPAMMFAPELESKVFLSDHFTRSGPSTAHELVELSESSPELRRILERLTTGSSMFAVAFAVIGYTAPPILWTLGMREHAQRLTMVAGGAGGEVDPEQVARMMADYAGAASPHEPGAQGAEQPPPEHAAAAAAAAGADSPQL
jgi:hypothetical protein